MFKRYILYLIRWQLSTPLLAVVLILLADMNTIVATIVSNFIGGLIFFWVDRWIFQHKDESLNHIDDKNTKTDPSEDISGAPRR